MLAHARNTLQLELKHYIDNHAYETVLQDNGVAFLLPVLLADDNLVYQWEYVETYYQARQALGY